MNTNEIRKLYDDADTLHRMIKNVGDAAHRNLDELAWGDVKENFERMWLGSEYFLAYMAEKIIPKINQHPDHNRSGGVFIDGVKQ